jgi:hypothetical protein
MLTRFACPLPLVPAKLFRIAFGTAVMALLLSFAATRMPVSGAAAVMLKICAGVAIYSVFVLAFDIAGIRRGAQSLLSGMRRRYLVQST